MSASETNILRILFLLSVVSIVCVYNVTGAVVENVEDIRISRYYEKCKSSDDCFDYRLICKTQADNETRCVCDMFHMWNDQFNVCVQRYNSTHMVSLLIEKYDHASLIEKEAKLIYFGAVVAGFVVLSVGFACVVAIICYCHHMRIRLNRLSRTLSQRRSMEKQELPKPK